ncbi:ABC transporter substrate-binding protein OS=Castellaniella sp OX=1955812 GN=EPN31_03820 PE=3 SV=1 [Castellaniella denitrificans]
MHSGTFLKHTLAVALLGMASAAHADLTVGVVLPLTGPTSALGIPINQVLKLWPEEIAGEKVRIVLLDDQTDVTTAIRNTRRLVTDEKADVILGSVATPIAIAMAEVAAEAKTPQLALAPIPLPPGKDTWSFRLAYSSAAMAHAMLRHMVDQGIKTLGFLGYTDAYGETWLQDMHNLAADAGIKLVAEERFQRTDTSVTGQVLKLVAANPDAVLVVASGSGAALPHRELVDRGYAGKIYQTHAAASRDLMRVGRQAVDGGYVVSVPAVVAKLLPEGHPSKKAALDYMNGYESSYGKGSWNQFAALGFDALLVLKASVPIALKTAQPGTAEFRRALRDAVETMPAMPVLQGVLDYTSEDHWGFTEKSPVVLKIVKGNWSIEPL